MADFPTEGRPPFINRRLNLEEWRRYVAGYDFGSLAPSRLVLHHTERPTEAEWNGLGTMRAIQRFYASKGWSAGPHIFVAPDGIWLATPMSEIGIHAGLGNGSLAQGWYSLGLEMVGNFDRQPPQGLVWQYALAVMGELSRRLAIPPARLISFHRDYTNAKSCPGWAVNKDWVWSSVAAYLNQTSPPAPTPPAPAPIPPAEQLLHERLLEETFRQRSNGQGYHLAWAFHQYAVEQALGAPMGPSSNLDEGGRTYNFQPFARDTLYSEVPNWSDVRTLAQLLSGSIPPDGLGRRLLEATYRSGGVTFRPDWAFHQYALLNRLGPPLGPSTTLKLDGRSYAYEVFAGDTIYNLVPNWSAVQRLSALASTGDAALVRLRETLLTATYAAIGQTYHPEWSFHQYARNLALGAPISGSYQINVAGANYALQVYALDTLYNLVPNWSDVRRMSMLGGQGQPILGAAALTGESTTFADSPGLVTAPGEPPGGPALRIVRVTPQAAAQAERGGKAVEWLILHAMAGPAAVQLAAMTTLDAHVATHYYLGLDGVISQLVDEAYAAWHAGIASADGLWWNLNRTSIGIALERPTGWPAAGPGDTTAQVEALTWLLGELGQRYPIDASSLLLWSSLAGSNAEALAGLPLEALREALK